jgi:hypothetical protein
MKNTILFLTLFSFTGTAQTVETLKKDLAKSKTENQKLTDENKFLIEKLNFCNAIAADTNTEIKSFSNLYSFNVLSCKGDSKSQTVTIELLVEQNSTNKKFTVDYSRSNAIDIIGKQFQFVNRDNGSYEFYTVYTSTPIRLSIVVKNIMPGTEAFSMIALMMATDEMDKNPKNFQLTEIRNLKIVW